MKRGWVECIGLTVLGMCLRSEQTVSTWGTLFLALVLKHTLVALIFSRIKVESLLDIMTVIG